MGFEAREDVGLGVIVSADTTASEVHGAVEGKFGEKLNKVGTLFAFGCGTISPTLTVGVVAPQVDEGLSRDGTIAKPRSHLFHVLGVGEGDEDGHVL